MLHLKKKLSTGVGENSQYHQIMAEIMQYLSIAQPEKAQQENKKVAKVP